jgi:GNAT superfamily N-acetyltransferase
MRKWKELAEAIQSEETILGYRNTPENLLYLSENGLAVTKEVGDKIIVFGGLWTTADSAVFEAGSFWVHPDHRGQKLSSWMFSELSLLIPRGAHAVAISHVPKVIHLLRKYSWEEALVPNWEAVIPFSVSCGPCDEVADDEKKTCPYKALAGHCQMFFKEG